MLLAAATHAANEASHYWDCCKPSCGWDFKQGKGRIATRANCDSSGRKLFQAGLKQSSACAHNGDGVTMCPDQVPFYADGRWHAFTAVQDHGNYQDCCSCFELQLVNFSTPVVLQVTNHGQLGGNSGGFDVLVPGGGLGDFDGCRRIFPGLGSVPQDRRGGLHNPADCGTAFRGFAQDAAACEWMFADDSPFPFPVKGIQYPGNALVASSRPVACPAALNERSGCWSDGPMPPGPSPGPPPTPTPTPPAPPGGCALLSGVNFWGGDISSAACDQPEQCCARCKATRGCVAFTHNLYDPQGQRQNWCYLKDRSDSRRQDAAATSGLVSSAPPGPAPPPPPPSPPKPPPSPGTTYKCFRFGRHRADECRPHPNAPFSSQGECEAQCHKASAGAAPVEAAEQRLA